MIIRVASGKGGTGKTTIATNCNLKDYLFLGYLPFRRAFTQDQLEGKTFLEYVNSKHTKKVLAGLWEKLHQQIQEVS